jgi:hypothetical protein
MQVRRKTLKPAYGFWISVRPHRDVMRAVPHINPRGVSMKLPPSLGPPIAIVAPIPFSPSGFATTSLPAIIGGLLMEN